MIYLISDTHNGESMKGLLAYLEVAKKDDLLLILGDVGIAFGDSAETRRFTEYFEALDVNIAFIDGNHENHPYINAFPLDTAFGAPVHRISKSIVHLMRGNIYSIEGKSFFVMGGCKSSAKWKELGLYYEGEEPTSEEISLAYENLKKCGNKVDYILTHKYIIEKEKRAGADALTLEGLMNYLDESVDFSHWYSGHWHSAFKIDGKHTVVYDKLCPLS